MASVGLAADFARALECFAARLDVAWAVVARIADEWVLCWSGVADAVSAAHRASESAGRRTGRIVRIIKQRIVVRG